MTPKERIAEIDQTLSAIRSGWPRVVVEVENILAGLTESLVSEDNEQTRGRIKALREVKELPETLFSERAGLEAALSEQDAADFE